MAYKKILLIKSFVFWRKIEKWNEIRYWTFVELATLETNAIWRMNFFSDACRYCLTTTVRKFNDFNIGIVDAIQKKFVYLHEMGERIKSLLL